MKDCRDCRHAKVPLTAAFRGDWTNLFDVKLRSPRLVGSVRCAEDMWTRGNGKYANIDSFLATPKSKASTCPFYRS